LDAGISQRVARNRLLAERLFPCSRKRKLLKTHQSSIVMSTLQILKNAGVHAALIGAVIVGAVASASAGDLRITISKHTKPTPVQQLNREGVKALEKHRIEKAARLFYRAYLLDPDDPFTLNNLGYVSELQGRLERAERYYTLAAAQQSEAVIAQSTTPELKGKTLSAATTFAVNRNMRVNRDNLEAMSLLQEGRAREAEDILLNTLASDPRNPFTLNNLGYTMEAEGNLEGARKYYMQAAAVRSSESIVVALDPHWRGKEISSVAEDNVRVLDRKMETEQSIEARAARFNLQGVFDLNHNDPQSARAAFEKAYKLDPYSAFALNNMGYVSEMNGDHETAGEFYAAAGHAPDARQPATVTNHIEMNGQPLAQVAATNVQSTDATLEMEQEARRRQGGPIELKTRDGKPIVEEPQTPESNVPRPPDSNVSQPPVPRPPQ